jgi:hypothetical protein
MVADRERGMVMIEMVAAGLLGVVVSKMVGSNQAAFLLFWFVVWCISRRNISEHR